MRLMSAILKVLSLSTIVAFSITKSPYISKVARNTAERADPISNFSE
jgi:hypothetical protein